MGLKTYKKGSMPIKILELNKVPINFKKIKTNLDEIIIKIIKGKDKYN